MDISVVIIITTTTDAPRTLINYLLIIVFQNLEVNWAKHVYLLNYYSKC